MLNYFSTNLAILHKKHMLKICTRALAGAISNGAHGQLSRVSTGIVTIFARTFFITVRTFCHLSITTFDHIQHHMEH